MSNFISILFLICQASFPTKQQAPQCAYRSEKPVSIRKSEVKSFQSFDYFRCNKVEATTDLQYGKFSGCDGLKTEGCEFLMIDGTYQYSAYGCDSYSNEL